MKYDKKRKSLIFLALASIAIVLIAAGLPQFNLQPGISLPGWEVRPGALPAESVPMPLISVNTFFRAILGFILGMVLAYCGYKLIKGATWKEVLSSARFVAILGLVFLVAIGILFALVNLHITTLPLEPEVIPPALDLKGPQLGPLPSGLIWLVWTGLCLVIVLLGAWMIRWQIQRSRAGDSLSMEVERALQALRSGESFKNVIVRCYREMSTVLQKEQGIEMEETMTSQEFKRLLLVRGIPRAPIDQLTRLFEAARYGYRPPTPVNEQEAYECLNAIVLHVREAKKAALR